MNKVRVIIQSLVLLLFSVTMTGAAPINDAATFSALLAYPPTVRSPATSRLFRSHGKAYRFQLKAERDGDGILFGFEVVMEGSGRSRQGSNFLDPTGRVHGLQKWDFLASDFAPDRSARGWGNRRIVHLPNLGLDVQIEAMRFGIKRKRRTPLSTENYEFTNLTVKVVVKPASGAAR